MSNKILFVCIFFGAFSIFADEDVKVIQQDNVDYVCFDQAASQVLLDMRLKYPLLEKENTLLKDQVTTKEAQIIKWQMGAENLTSQIVILTDSNAALQTKIDSSNAWYKSNILWTAVGFVVGVGITIGVVKALNP